MSHWPVLQQIASMKDNDMKILNYLYFMASNRGCRYAINHKFLREDLGLSKATLFRSLKFLKDHHAIRDVVPTDKEASLITWQDYHWIEVANLSQMPNLFLDKRYAELHSHNGVIAKFEKEGGFWAALKRWNFGRNNMNQSENQNITSQNISENITDKNITENISGQNITKNILDRNISDESSKEEDLGFESQDWASPEFGTQTEQKPSLKNETQKRKKASRKNGNRYQESKSLTNETTYPDFSKSAYNQDESEIRVSRMRLQQSQIWDSKTLFSHSLEQKGKTGRDERNVVSPSLEKVKNENSSKIGFCCGAEERGTESGGALENGNAGEMPKVIFVQGMKIFVIENIYQIENININENNICNNISNTNTIEEENIISDDKALDTVLPILDDNAIGSKGEEDLPLPPPAAEGLGEYAVGLESLGLDFLTQTEADEFASECDSSSEERKLLEEARNAFYGLTGTESGMAVKGSVSFCENKQEVKAMVNDEDKKARREEIRQMAFNAITRASAVPEPSKVKLMQQQKLEDEKKEKAERFQVKRGRADASGPQPFELYAFIAQEGEERGKKIPALIPKDAKRLKDFAKRCKQNGLEWQDCLKEIFLIMQRKKKIFCLNEILAAWNFDEAFDTLVNKKQEKIEQHKKIDSRITGSFELTLAE